MKRWLTTGTGLLMLVFLVIGCAPRTSAPASAPQVPAAAPAPVPTSNIPLPTSQDAAWARVVDAARKEVKLTLYGYYLVGDTGLAVSRAFYQKYGIKMDIITGRGAEQNERLRTEARTGQVMADILDTSASHALNTKRFGLTIPSPDLPVLREKDVWVVDVRVIDPELHVFRFTPSYRTIYINTNLVKLEEAPRSWSDLLNPRWKGKIMLNDPAISSGEYLTFVPMLNQKVIDLEYLRVLGRQDLQFTTGNVQSAEKLARGELPLADNSESSAAKIVREGAPVRALDLKEGAVGVSGAVMALKNSPHPNAAKVYLNWLLSPEGDLVYGQANATPPLRKSTTSYVPAGAAASGEKVIAATAQDIQDSDLKFQDKLLVELWKGAKK